MNKTRIAALIIIILSFIFAAILYPMMPSKVASHWNSQGQVDGYMSKFWGLFLMPFLSLAMFLLFIFLPHIDPLKKNYKDFRSYYEGLILLMIAFLFYVYLLTIFWNMEARFSMIQMLVPAFAVLFFYCGLLIEKVKRNWFVGIKTPWTLSSDKVWDKTHKLGGQLFKAAAVICLIGLFAGQWAIWFTIVPVLIFTIYIYIYSYLEYRKEKKI